MLAVRGRSILQGPVSGGFFCLYFFEMGDLKMSKCGDGLEALEVLSNHACLSAAVEFMAFCAAATEISSGRAKGDFLADRIAMSSNESTLFKCLALFRKSLNVGPGKDEVMMAAARSKYADAALRLIREYPTEVTSLLFVKKDKKGEKSWNLFELADFKEIEQTPIPKRLIQYPISVELTEPLVHGDENKQGNATLFRRRKTSNGMTLPFYSSNSIGHHLRVLLAEDFLKRIGLHQSTTDRRYMVWFNEFLHNGGKLGAASKEFCNRIGGTANGALKSDGMRELRNMFPFISILGGNAKGSFEGRIMIKDLRPVCLEWGTGEKRCSDLLAWEFGTTPDPFAASSVSKMEAKKIEKDGREAQANSSMIYKFQVLSVGTELEGGFNLSPHSTGIEKSCFGHGIDLLIEHGHLGGKSNKGYGGCNITCKNKPDSKLYLDYLEGEKGTIMEYIRNIGAYK